MENVTGRKTEIQLACELVRVLNGISIEHALDALGRARSLLLSTQVVNADSPLLGVMDETAKALQAD